MSTSCKWLSDGNVNQSWGVEVGAGIKVLTVQQDSFYGQREGTEFLNAYWIARLVFMRRLNVTVLFCSFYIQNMLALPLFTFHFNAPSDLSELFLIINALKSYLTQFLPSINTIYIYIYKREAL